MTSGALIVLGTSSGAGKSTLTAGLCRWLARQGVTVAPFKAQNMSLNSFVTRRGEEIARAQAAQAWAAGVEPEVAMNPVLLKPGSDRVSQMVVMGRPAGDLDAGSWADKHRLLDLVLDAFSELRKRFDVVVCEGAGSPAEVNLRPSDIVNLGFARAAGIPAIMVGDIDRGGVFASFVGTLALLDRDDQDLVRGFVVNRFRGDASLLAPALDDLSHRTDRPVLGVVPYVEGLGIDAEDAPDLALYQSVRPPIGQDVLRVGVVRLPRASNLTDFDPLAAEPGVIVRFLSHPEEMADCDLVVLPGTRASVGALRWLRAQGSAEALAGRASTRRPVLGICGGYQLLGQWIDDDVESHAGRVEGLGLLPVCTTFQPEKLLARPMGQLKDGGMVEGYEIRHGRVRVEGGTPLFADEGCRIGVVAGTTWHGLFENDGFRRTYLGEIAARTGRSFVPDGGFEFSDWRHQRLERTADLVETHLDTSTLLALFDGGGTPPGNVRLTLAR